MTKIHLKVLHSLMFIMVSDRVPYLVMEDPLSACLEGELGVVVSVGGWRCTLLSLGFAGYCRRFVCQILKSSILTHSLTHSLTWQQKANLTLSPSAEGGWLWMTIKYPGWHNRVWSRHCTKPRRLWNSHASFVTCSIWPSVAVLLKQELVFHTKVL